MRIQTRELETKGDIYNIILFLSVLKRLNGCQKMNEIEFGKKFNIISPLKFHEELRNKR